MNFVKKVFTDFLVLKEETSYKIYKKNTFTQESTKQTGSNSRSDFILNFKGIKIVVEVEKTGNIEPGIKQIKEYMKLENTLYGILTDGEKWYFYNNGFDEKFGKFGTSILKGFDELISDSGKTFFSQTFETKKYYINFLNRIDTESFLFEESNLQKDLKSFHKELIEVAEKLKADFEKSGIFDGDEEKEIIQTVYSFIIQFLLIKIIQDKKKNIELINKKEFVKLLEEEKYSALANNIFKQIDWLGDFYDSYKNEQKHLIDKILKHYNDGLFGSSLDFDAIQGFLDLYIFIFKFNFKNVKQDIFGAVYENYLKELYKDDNSKKGQVFTPPEIVDFMLDEIGYTHDYIKKIILDYIEENGLETLQENLLKNETKPDFNIPGLSIIDPACGSGTFLYKASSRIVQAIFMIENQTDINQDNPKYAGILSENLILNNIFGFDIEAFPLYLAEMNILQTLLWFNIDDNTGKVLNKIDKQIRIFSTTDTIGEFANMQNNMDEILENLEKEGIFSVNEKRSPKAISELKLDIISGDLEKKLDKYLVNHIGKELIHIDKDLEKRLHKIDNITQLKKYINDNGSSLLQGYYKNLLSRDKTKGGRGMYIDKLKELAQKYKTSRTKFDFVLANPPYVRQTANYNNKNLFGININESKYSKIFLDNGGEIRIGNSKFNIYGYFYYLSFFILKEGGKMGFINPRTLLFQPSFHKLRQFLKYNTKILKIVDFVNGIVFYNRGINGKIEVITDACITFIKKEKKDDYSFDRINYNGNEKLVDLSIFKKNNTGIMKQNISDIFDYKGYKFFHYFNELMKKDDDFHISIYPRINLKLSNIDKKGLPIIKPNGFYTSIGEDYYNFKEEGVLETYPTCDKIVNKQYKISWSSITHLWSMEGKIKNGLPFTFTDYKWTNRWDTFTSIGINDINNIKELYFIFSLLNSKTIQYYIVNNFSGNINKTNLWLLDFPCIDSKVKEELKAKLIKNGEKIIESVKKGDLENLKYRDILEIGIEGLDEKILGLKEQFLYLQIDASKINTNKIDEKLNKDILVEIMQDNDLEKLEQERDLLVYCLYFGKETIDENSINLKKIDIENIEKNKQLIQSNKFVGLILK